MGMKGSCWSQCGDCKENIRLAQGNPGSSLSGGLSPGGGELSLLSSPCTRLQGVEGAGQGP